MEGESRCEEALLNNEGGEFLIVQTGYRLNSHETSKQVGFYLRLIVVPKM